MIKHHAMLEKLIPDFAHTLEEGKKSYRGGEDVIGTNAYHVFIYGLRKGVVRLPEGYDTAFQTVATGMWKEKPVMEKVYVAHTSGVEQAPAELNSIVIPENDTLNDAFSFFALLNLLEKEDYRNGRIGYVQGNRRVNLELMPDRRDYQDYTRHSIFGRFISDQELLKNIGIFYTL